jgi:uridine phosphorylase
MNRPKHIRCLPSEIGKYVLIPGDPARALKIAELLPNARQVIENREFHVYTGEIKGEAVTVCSTGIGGPSASIAVEELAQLGAKTFIRVGSAGARQEWVPIGALVIATAAYRGDGTSRAYAPVELPAVADLRVTCALIEACRELEYEHFVGLVYSRDAFYVQNRELNEFLKTAGILAAEQECATIFTIGLVRQLSVGAILATDSNIWLKEQPTFEEKESLFRQAEIRAIKAALRAVEILIQKGDLYDCKKCKKGTF